MNALQLRAALGNAFSVLDCRRALLTCDNNASRAAEWLAEGRWAQAKSVSWNWDGLQASLETLVAETQQPRVHCLKVLQNCAGHLALARRKLAGLPALAAFG